MKVRVKICCIKSEEEAKTAISIGASAIGLVAKMPSGPGPIDDETIFRIAKSVPPPIATFLLTSETSSGEIIKHHYRTLTNTIQIVDEIDETTIREIKNSLPVIRIVPVVHVINERSVEYALKMSELAHALLLDSGNPALKTKVLGGTGKVHDWKLSRLIVEQSKVPVFLAGGLNPDNVKEAVDTVMPFGVDICSGVRIDGDLNLDRLEKFFKALG
jgi:phosphoribosylanthranilate isomerase